MQEGAPLQHFGGLHGGRLAGLGGFDLVFEGVFAAVLVVLVWLLLRQSLSGQLDRCGGMIRGLSLDFDYPGLSPLCAIYGVGGDRPNISGTSGPCYSGGSLRAVVRINLFFELLKSLTIIVIVVIDDLPLFLPHSGRPEHIVRHRLAYSLLYA